MKLLAWLRRRRSAATVEPDAAERPPPNPAYQERLNGWMRRTFPPLGFYAEFWRDPQHDPDLPALVEKYGSDRAAGEVARLQQWLLREVIIAASGLLYTLGKIEELLAELQAYVDHHVEPLPEGEPWPQYGYSIAHPHVSAASFEFGNLLAWLRTIEERLDRPHRPWTPNLHAGLLPSLADRPLRARVEALVTAFRAKALERKLANYVLHAGAVPQPLEGAQLSEEHRVSLHVPDRPAEDVDTRWHLTYEQERDALTVGREAAQAVEELVDALLDAFEEETRAIEAEREQARAGGVG